GNRNTYTTTHGTAFPLHFMMPLQELRKDHKDTTIVIPVGRTSRASLPFKLRDYPYSKGYP
ncbi:MAG: hypothetical protein K2J46_10015, partial [Muribaculaceae bacterium]|nr:hypothetical protein [Muribaculaceae bacterium]